MVPLEVTPELVVVDQTLTAAVTPAPMTCAPAGIETNFANIWFVTTIEPDVTEFVPALILLLLITPAVIVPVKLEVPVTLSEAKLVVPETVSEVELRGPVVTVPVKLEVPVTTRESAVTVSPKLDVPVISSDVPLIASATMGVVPVLISVAVMLTAAEVPFKMMSSFVSKLSAIKEGVVIDFASKSPVVTLPRSELVPEMESDVPLMSVPVIGPHEMIRPA